MPDLIKHDRARLLRRGRRLEHATIAWNAVEAIVAIGAGLAAGSIALVGFGGDSVIETVAAVFVLRRLNAEIAGHEQRARDRERRALRVIAFTFWALAAYILYEAVRALVGHETPAESALGITLAAISLVVMPLLGWAKKRTGDMLGSRALVADAWETFVCSYLSFTLLLGLVLNSVVGWWWADPLAAMLMIPFLMREGREAASDAAAAGAGQSASSPFGYRGNR
jgi:divalent metal cation (Fe/Co/Zn/Cd) transporter